MYTDSQEKNRKIFILATGGTIAGLALDPEQPLAYRAGILDIQSLVKGIHPIDKPFSQWDIECEQLFNMDSKDLGMEHWAQLRRRCSDLMQREDVEALLITHGTDTVEETAYFLARTLVLTKPLILTCAMRPANAVDADGPANLAYAIQVAQQAKDEGLCGVVLASAGKVWSALEVEKVHPRAIEAFGARELCVTQEEALPNKQAQTLNDIHWAFRTLPQVFKLSNKLLASTVWPWVEIVTACAGANPLAIQVLVNAGVRGLVVACTGNGTIHSNWERALLAAKENGVLIWRVTRCAQSNLLPEPLAALPSVALSPVKARIELMLRILEHDFAAVEAVCTPSI